MEEMGREKRSRGKPRKDKKHKRYQKRYPFKRAKIKENGTISYKLYTGCRRQSLGTSLRTEPWYDGTPWSGRLLRMYIDW